MRILALMGRFRIGTRIYAGFVIVLGLMAVLAYTGYSSLMGASERSRAYAHFSDQTADVLSIRARLSDMQQAVLRFVLDGDTDDLSQARKIGANLTEQAQALTASMLDPARKERSAEISKHISDYVANIERVGAARARRDEQIEKRLNVVDKTAADNLNRIIDSAMGEADFEPAAHAYFVLDKLMQARLSAQRYLHDQNPKTAESARSKLNAFAQAAEEGIYALQDPARVVLMEEAATLAVEYAEAFRNVVEASSTYSVLVNGAMFQAESEAAQLAQALSQEMTSEREKIERDTIEANASAMMMNLGIAVVAAALGVVFAWLIKTGITRPVIGMTETMTRLAAGDTSVSIPAQDNRDEIGTMAKAVGVFKDNAVARERLEAEQAQERNAREERARRVEAMIGSFDREVATALEAVGGAAGTMQATSQAMSATAEETSRQATAVAAASEQASANVQTVAAAAEELAASIREISRQMSEAHTVTTDATGQAEGTRASVRGLAEAAQRIGDVVDLINSIAAQTNLLALNATIEAARAGDAGKGFAVVAGEVKALAGQTARATDEISSQINTVRTEIRGTVQAMEGIVATIGRINAIAASVAAAIEQQDAATREIARNVDQASVGTQEVSSTIAGVTRAAHDTGAASGEVLQSAGQLSRQAEGIRRSVDTFLQSVRAA
ncbi:MAG: methyl-accepting chemotaxis protein [Defluviicoccus sp.]|nr:methyl-accepting chemotaxis protein [Defluviicoccus sp.]MDG4609880.1 methyl-accepting chemotaxis protein [Defluviicoccus sp.]